MQLAAAGLALDPTYTAKAAAEALAALAAAGAAAGREASPRATTSPAGPPQPLFWHTLSAAEPPLAEAEDVLLARLPERFRRCLEGG